MAVLLLRITDVTSEDLTRRQLYLIDPAEHTAEPRLESRERSARLEVTVTESETALHERQRLSRYSADHSNLLQHGRHIDTMSLAGHLDVMLSQRIQAVDLPPRT